MPVDLKMNVLIVDDYKTMLRIVDGLLRQLGFSNIIQASDGTAALRSLGAPKFGLRERGRREAGRREQLHHQAVQRRDLETEAHCRTRRFLIFFWGMRHD
jgi:CheY-like chemotaxis protein